MLNPNAFAFAFAYNRAPYPILEALERLDKCNVPSKDRTQIRPLLTEWCTSPILNSILTKW